MGCKDGPPAWIYYVYLPFALRSRFIEGSLLMYAEGLKPVHLLYFCLGVLEHMDWFTDALFPIQAYACDATVTPSWALTWHESSLPIVGEIVSAMHFWFISLLVFIAAALSQQAVAHSYGKKDCAAAADVAAFGGIASLTEVPAGHDNGPHFLEVEGDLNAKLLFLPVVKVMLENC